MMEITAKEQNRGKKKKRRMERIEDSYSGTILNTATFELQGSQKKRKGLRKYLKDDS